MLRNFIINFILFPFLFSINVYNQVSERGQKLFINDEGYFELPGLNIMLFNDFYPEGHQGGFTIIQFGDRVAANGDLRLEPTPGQWSPVPKIGKRIVDKKNGVISVELWYPDSSKNMTGFNPIKYPDLKFKYIVRAEAIDSGIKLTVDLEKSLPEEWDDKIGFNLELFPGEYFGEHYIIDGKTGIFPRQADGTMFIDNDGDLQSQPLASGKDLILCPGNKMKEIKFLSKKNDFQLIDGRGLHNNGWFILRSTISAGAQKNAVEWIITPTINTQWRYKPVVQISQIGYHPDQKKFAVIELDKLTEKYDPIQLIKIDGDSEKKVKEEKNPVPWGNFLRYKYLRFDFRNAVDEGLYKIKYGEIVSNLFEIKKDIYTSHVWQPTLEYFLPVQMCHMRVEEKYRVWHGICHMDDAVMAPINHIHFDDYNQGPSTLTEFKSGEHITGINIGGWHDAGDYDLRVESQAETVYKLSLTYEFFKNDYDQTSIDQDRRLVEINKPDGKPDLLQQVEHGLLSIIGGYENLGRLYRGIQEKTLHQYVLLGEGGNATDNLVYKPGNKDPILQKDLPDDDRLVFTEKNPRRELYVSQVLAAAYRTMKEFNPELAEKCLRISGELYKNNLPADTKDKIGAAAELYLSTSKDEYKKFILKNEDFILNHILEYGLVLGRVTEKLNKEEFIDKINEAVKSAYENISNMQKDNPYGVPYKPLIWGAGWQIQSFGVTQLFLHLGFPKIFSSDYAFNALNFVLGCHPGKNTASFVSGVGVNSLTTAYGFNRADWSYIPGGVASGTALIRPDLPELKIWPYFWQQTEYVMGGGGTDFMLLAVAADYLFNKR